jgi:hypothetical protein
MRGSVNFTDSMEFAGKSCIFGLFWRIAPHLRSINPALRTAEMDLTSEFLEIFRCTCTGPFCAAQQTLVHTAANVGGLLIAATNYHLDLTHKSGPLLGPFLIKWHALSIYY